MSRRSRWWSVVGLACAVALAAVWWVTQSAQEAAHPELCSALVQLRLSRVYAEEGLALSCPRVTRQALPPALHDALASQDPGRVAELLREAKGSALAVATAGSAGGVLQGLRQMRVFPELRAVVLAPELAVYTVRETQALSLAERDALAYVARGLLRGAREPSLSSFPPALRQVARVEVMVLLRERGEARLWRSAKGTSLARALLTAARVARERWRERESAMGGALTKRLLDLDVEVALLSEDGTLFSLERSFVDRALRPEHGIGFEYLNGWHYVLPADMQRRGQRSPFRALQSLLREQSLPDGVLGQSALRAYRMLADTLAVSRAPLSAGNGPAR